MIPDDMELIHSKVIERALVKKIKRTIPDNMEFVQTKVIQRTLFREDSTEFAHKIFCRVLFSPFCF